MNGYVQLITDFIAQNPHRAGLVAFAVAAGWLLEILVVRALPLPARMQAATVSWARVRTGPLPHLIVRTLDPEVPGSRTVLLLGTTVLICAIGFFSIVENVIARDTIVQADSAISHFIQTFRTAWSDRVMIAATMYGDTVVGVSVAGMTIAWMVWRHYWHLAGGFAVALALTAVFVFAFKEVLRLARPIALSTGANAFSFPSGHATMSAALYGMLGRLASNALTPRWRLVPVIVSGAPVGTIVASRLYIAAHWPSDVAAGLLPGFGFAAISVSSIVA